MSGVRGHCGVDGKTSSVEEVAKNVMQILSDTLTDLKACLEDAVMVHVFVNNMDDFTKVNSVYKTFFTVNPPARACVQLDLPEDIVIQVECLVYSPQTANHQIEAPVREAMHVQSISHWAPANIGPYSQAIKVGDTMFVSGSIGLWPPTMTLIAGGVLEEASLSLQHVDRIISAFVSGESLKSIVHGFCFVTSSAAVSVAKNALYEASGIKPDDGEQDLPHLPVMLFVVVPALPKGASVEWHVVAQDSQIQHQYDSHSLCREGFNIDVQSVAIKGRSNFSVAINCVVESNSAIICNLEEILACFVSELQGCASQHSISLSNLMYTRIFYVKDIMDHLNARKFIQEYLKRTNVPPVFSLVCVNALEREQSLLAFSCLLQRPEIDEEE